MKKILLIPLILFSLLSYGQRITNEARRYDILAKDTLKMWFGGVAGNVSTDSLFVIRSSDSVVRKIHPNQIVGSGTAGNDSAYVKITQLNDSTLIFHRDNNGQDTIVYFTGGGGSGGASAWGDITGTLSAQTDLQTALNLKANLASPTFTGTVTIPTPFTLGAVSVLPTGTELNFVDGVTSAIQTQLDAKQPLDADLTTIAGLTATTDNFIQSKAGAWASRTIAQVKTDLGLTGTNSGDQTTIVGITGTLAQFNTAVTDADLAPIASPTFTGTPTLPTGSIGTTQSAGNSTTALATTAFVTTADNLKANLASPTFTGTPAGPTAASGTNTTQLATTAYVMAAAQDAIDDNPLYFDAGDFAGAGTVGDPITIIGGGGGETNTGSNLGGGLANYSTKVGVDLQFNSFAAADFDLASNLISIDATKWLTSAAAAAAYQPLDGDLTTVAGLTATTDNFIQSKAGAWASRTVAQVKTDLGLTGTNSGDQTTIAGITGTLAQFNTAVTDANLAPITGVGLPGEWVIACSDETTAITTGTGKVTFRVPFAATVTAVRASVNTVSSSGIPTFDINEAGTTILSTKLTIDASEKTSVTAAAAAVISDAALADDAEMTIDFDVAGTGAKGVKIIIYYTRN